jgi:uncharacterized protein
MNKLGVVAISARVMAELAALDGFAVFAADLFGDVDTRRACQDWQCAGESGSLLINTTKVMQWLHGLARRGDMLGWVPGSGFEALPALLAEGAALLPLIGMPARDVQRVRDPRVFFDFLATHGLAHPPVCFGAPAKPGGWLIKNAGACGGGHIRALSPDAATLPDALHYFQRKVDGTPMSATFVANGREARLLGINQLLVQPPPTPYAYAGVIGPVPLAEPAAGRLQCALGLLSAGMALRGLCSLDFMFDGSEVLLLEVNPRPPASMALYGRRVRGGLMRAHVDACRLGVLPTLAALPPGDGAVHGEQIIFARHPLQIDAATSRTLHTWPGCHDVPAAGTAVAPGAPLCSLSAAGASAEQVQARLARGRLALLNALERPPHGPHA